MNEINTDLIVPTGKRILIRVEEMKSETNSGLVIADTATNNAPVTGTVISVGEESKFQSGQQVFFRRYSIDELKIVSPTGEQLFYFLEDADVLATLKVETKT